MASNMSFADWRQANSEGLMATAEALLDKLEGVADLLTQIDEKNMVAQRLETSDVDEDRTSIISRFQEGVESARGVVGVLKREKWRLNKREMSVELKMGELEDYKSHLRNDMSSLNQTVDVLSMRVVQLENQLADAQDVQENLEADIAERKKSGEAQTARIAELQSENMSLRSELRLYQQHTSHTLATQNKMLENELLILRDENQRLKELVRSAESHQEHCNSSEGDYLSRLTNDFLKELSSLEVENSMHGQSTNEEVLSPGAKNNTNHNHPLQKSTS